MNITYSMKITALIFLFKIFLFFILFYFFTLQYCIGFAIHWQESATGYVSSHIPFSPPSHIISLGHPSAPAPSILYPALNLDWWFVSYMIVYMFQCHSPKSSHLLPLPQNPQVFYTSVSLLLSHVQGYHYHLSKFRIYVLVYCIGVFLSGLLHSVKSAPVSSTSLELIQMYYF